jgi:hypothetical protein
MKKAYAGPNKDPLLESMQRATTAVTCLFEPREDKGSTDTWKRTSTVRALYDAATSCVGETPA